MIKLEISGETPELFAAALAAFTGIAAGVAPTLPAPAPAAKPARVSKKETSVDPTGSAGTAGTGATSGSSDAAAANGSITRDSVSAKCMEYGQPSKGGPAALKELMVKHGSPEGRFSLVPEENLPALYAEVTELLG